MNVSKVLDSKAAMVAIGIVAAAGVLFVCAKKAGGAIGEAADDLAKKVGPAVNPLSDQNLIYRGLNAVGDAIDDGNKDNGSFSLGSKIYDMVDSVAGWFGMSDADKQRKLEQQASSAGQSLDEQLLRADMGEGIT